jgi:hypothetical protein
MSRFSSNLYASLKKHGLHQWGPFHLEANKDYDWNDLDPAYWDRHCWLGEPVAADIAKNIPKTSKDPSS